MRLYTINKLILLFVLIAGSVTAQVEHFANPVKIPVYLSGNFCELRPNHFHGGIDIKTQQKTGVPIYAIAEGFICRIVVSPTGYGKALYVEHPCGKSSVYAHLDRFSDEIETFVKAEQYRRKSFAVDLIPPDSALMVEREQLIGYGGNSGSSGGPHLHFEIRDTETQDALNPLLYGFDVTDKVPPRFYSLLATPVDDNSHLGTSFSRRIFPVVGSGTTYTLKENPELEAYGRIGLAIRANDFYDNSHNICGIYTAELKVNGEVVFGYSFDRMPFSDTRYMNSHIDYELSLSNGNRVHRLWRQPGNRLGIYHSESDRGLINVQDGQIYDIEVTITDLPGNSAKLKFRIRGVNRNITRPVPTNAGFFTYDDENTFRTPHVELYAPVGAFYDDFYFTYQVITPTPDLFSKVHKIHSESVPVHLPVKLRILAEGLPQHLTEKSFIGKINANGGKSYVGGTISSGWFETEVRSLGTYAVMSDTIPPVITPLSIKDRSTLTESNRIRFTIRDNLSGIASYEGTINGEWVLFEYDAKNRLLTYDFDPDRFTPGKRHYVVLKVKDQVGNTSTYEATFWK